MIYPLRVTKKIIFPFVLMFFLFLNLLGQAELPEVSLEGDPFLKEFNEASDSLRLIGIFSPTCGHCLSACADLRQFLEEHPSADIQVFLLWSPFMGFDTKVTVRRSMRYLTDSRVTHLWDVWRFGSRSLAMLLDIPLLEAWDLYAAFAPGIKWEGESPQPAFWLQSRELKKGIPYTPAELEAQLEKWLD
ncbi:MAG: hypothetical protein ABIJ42_02765 [Acidobacteriota bacterium]